MLTIVFFVCLFFVCPQLPGSPPLLSHCECEPLTLFATGMWPGKFLIFENGESGGSVTRASRITDGIAAIRAAWAAAGVEGRSVCLGLRGPFFSFFVACSGALVFLFFFMILYVPGTLGADLLYACILFAAVPRFIL
jgi:hypothetical protein